MSTKESRFYSPSTMKAKQLRAKKRCCKSTCLHCPYGFTLKQCGLFFEEVNQESVEIFRILGLESQGDLSDYRIVTLKNYPIGLMRKNHIVVLDYWPLPDYQDQGIDLPLVESYFFY